MARSYACLTLEAASHPPLCAGFYTNPPIEAFGHYEGARNTEIIGGISVACVHDPRSSQKRHIDADGVIKGGSARTAKRSISCRSDDNGFADEKYSIVVSLKPAVFCSKIVYFYRFVVGIRGNVVAKSERWGSGAVGLDVRRVTLHLFAIAVAVAQQGI